MSKDNITITREHYERLKNERVVLFGENNGKWSDEELENNAIDAAIQAAGEMIEEHKLNDITLSKLTTEQFSEIIQKACWSYMQIYVNYIPF